MLDVHVYITVNRVIPALMNYKVGIMFDPQVNIGFGFHKWGYFFNGDPLKLNAYQIWFPTLDIYSSISLLWSHKVKF